MLRKLFLRHENPWRDNSVNTVIFQRDISDLHAVMNAGDSKTITGRTVVPEYENK